MDKNNLILKRGCYLTNLSMAAVSNLSPLLFLTFRSQYGISYSALGLLVTVNFCTQLGIDLIFSFFSHRFHIPKTVKITPVLTALGLLLFASAPLLFPQQVYVGLLLGTILFAASGGLAEVLISPVIAAIPSDNPDREMSKLHSVYAWGVVFVVMISTLFLSLLGKERWQWLALLWMVLPICSAIEFFRSKVPSLQMEGKPSGSTHLILNKTFLLSFLCIFMGGASENIMTQWSSSYLEQAVQIPKVWGDIFGVAMFGIMLGLGRTLYAKFGKNIHMILLFSAAATTLCYITAALTRTPLIGLIACGLTGLCTSMLWPGNLIVSAARFPAGGVMLYALMAAGGDLGGSVGPQLVGVVTDAAAKSEAVVRFARQAGLSIEQMGMKLGLLCAVLFPTVLIVLATLSFFYERRKNTDKKETPTGVI